MPDSASTVEAPIPAPTSTAEAQAPGSAPTDAAPARPAGERSPTDVLLQRPPEVVAEQPEEPVVDGRVRTRRRAVAVLTLGGSALVRRWRARRAERRRRVREELEELAPALALPAPRERTVETVRPRRLEEIRAAVRPPVPVVLAQPEEPRVDDLVATRASAVIAAAEQEADRLAAAERRALDEIARARVDDARRAAVETARTADAIARVTIEAAELESERQVGAHRDAVRRTTVARLERLTAADQLIRRAEELERQLDALLDQVDEVDEVLDDVGARAVAAVPAKPRRHLALVPAPAPEPSWRLREVALVPDPREAQRGA